MSFKASMDLLGFMYPNFQLEEEHIKKLREIRNQGVKYIRFFNCDRDHMVYENYTNEYYNELKRRLKILKDLDFIPIVSVLGYYRISAGWLDNAKINSIIQRTVYFTEQIMGKDNFIMDMAPTLT